MTTGFIIFLLIPYLMLGTGIYVVMFETASISPWVRGLLYIGTILLYIPGILLVTIIIILTYLYYGIKRSIR